MIGNGKRYLALLLLMGSVFLWGSCADGELPEAGCLEQPVQADGRGISLAGISDKLKEKSGEKEDFFLAGQAGHYAYDCLSEAEQAWYRDIADTLGHMEKDRHLSEDGLLAGLDETCIDAIFQCVMNDHPEIFYVDGYYYNQYTRGNRVVAIVFSGSYSMDQEEARARLEKIEVSAEYLATRIPEDAPDYDKVKYVYDTLIQNTEYDLESSDNQNIYSVFVNHSSVCQGYAKGTQYLLQKMGIECALVQGTVDTGEAHAWNLVKVDGNYYYVDTTWGDASYQMMGGNTGESRESSINYDYLCVTTGQLLRTHTLGGCVPMPECTHLEANYYVRENALFTVYDREQLAALFARAAEEQKADVTVKCADSGCFQEMKRMLVEEQEIFDYMENGGQEVTYASNEKQLSLTFWIK